MDPVVLLGSAVFAPLIGGLLTLMLPKGMIGPRVWLAAAGPAVSIALVLLVYLGQASAGDAPGATRALTWIPSLNLNIAFLPDGLGVFFAMLVAGIGVLIVLYARSYFGPDPDDLYRFYPTLGFFTTAMLGIVLADYLLLTLLFWEMTSISSFLLIGWDRYDHKAVKLAMQAFFTTGLGGIVGLLGGILLFGDTTGIWRWSELLAGGFVWDAALAWNNPVMWAFVLMFLGAATKSAQVPWHYWLPGAMAAPTPVSAFLHSATMVKAGVFLVGRMFPVFAALELWPWLIVPIGATTMLLGAALAINQHDLKRIFAYTTVSQLGLLVCMYGLGGLHFEEHAHPLAAIDWDITQIANHAFYKAPLFILAGAIGHLAGTRMLPELFGYFKQHKPTTIVMLMAAYALAALPGTISFQAKELFLYAIWHLATHVHPVFWIVMAMAVLTAIFNMAIFVRLATTLLGLPGGLRGTAEQEHAVEQLEEEHGHEPEAHHHEHGFWGVMLWLPALIIVVPQFVGGLYPLLWETVFAPLETNQNYFEHLPALWQLHLTVPLYMSAVAIAGGLALGLSPLMRGAVMDVFDRVYPAMYWLSVTGGGYAFRLVQTGHLRDYVLFVLGAFLVGFAASVAIDPGMFDAVWAAPEHVLEFWPGLLMGLITCATALALPLTQSRVLWVLLLGSCGFSVVGMYLIYQAPDLALTQVMVELISVILFVLVLRLLPERDPRPTSGRLWRGLVSAVVGLAFGWMVLVAAPMESGAGGGAPPRLGEFFAHHSYDGTPATDGRGGGGNNIVNVILVDFRSVDTLGEITVLAIAAMGVWSLIPAIRNNRHLSRRRRLTQKEPA